VDKDGDEKEEGEGEEEEELVKVVEEVECEKGEEEVKGRDGGV
jgi:hypothetical protein